MKDTVIDILRTVISFCLGASAMSPTDLTIDDDMFHLVNDVWGYFALVGIGLTLVYFLMEMNRKFAFERTDFTLKSFAAPFLKLGIAVFVLMNGAKLIAYIVELGNTMIVFADGLNITGKVTDNLLTTLEERFGDAGFLLLIVLVLPLLAILIVSAVCTLVWKYKALTYKIEFLFRIGISPVALADIYSGQNAQAIRWLKSMIGMGLYGMAMVLVVELGHSIGMQQIITSFNETMNEVSADDIWSTVVYIGMLPIVPVAELGVIGAVRSAIKEAIG